MQNFILPPSLLKTLVQHVREATRSNPGISHSKALNVAAQALSFKNFNDFDKKYNEENKGFFGNFEDTVLFAINKTVLFLQAAIDMPEAALSTGAIARYITDNPFTYTQAEETLLRSHPEFQTHFLVPFNPVLKALVYYTCLEQSVSMSPFMEYQCDMDVSEWRNKRVSRLIEDQRDYATLRMEFDPAFDLLIVKEREALDAFSQFLDNASSDDINELFEFDMDFIANILHEFMNDQVYAQIDAENSERPRAGAIDRAVFEHAADSIRPRVQVLSTALDMIENVNEKYAEWIRSIRS